MYLRTLLIIAILGLLAIFALLNWEAFLAQTMLSLGFTTVEAPLGLILLGVSGALTLLFLIYLVYWQSSVLMESRRHSRELQTQREIADNAEASRFHQLQTFVESELARLTNQTEVSREALIDRLDRLDRELRAAIEQSGNTLAAYLGEIDDRLGRPGSEKN